MTRTWPALITSLLALLSPAAVSYPAANCESDHHSCSMYCGTTFSGNPLGGNLQIGCRNACYDNFRTCDANERRADEEERQRRSYEAERQRQDTTTGRGGLGSQTSEESFPGR